MQKAQQIYSAHNGTVTNIRFGVDDAKLTYTGSFFMKGVKLGEIEHLSRRMADGVLLRECLEMSGGIISDQSKKKKKKKLDSGHGIGSNSG